MKKNYTAFTLAEVLITLGIIGVVAAMTLPALVNKYKERELITQVKKTYTSINQALALAQVKYGTPGDNGALFAADKTSEQVTQELAKYFNGARFCKTGANAKGCENLNYKIKYATIIQSGSTGNAAGMFNNLKNYPRIILNNGAMLGLISKQSGCDKVFETGVLFNSDGSIKKNEDGTNAMWTRTREICGNLVFDVNGDKLPNQFGRDAYTIDIFRNKVGNSTWNAYGTTTLNNILMDKKNPFVYKNYSEGDEFEW